ncbi:MAG: pilus assembly protein [Chloroflexi bacterium]|nr:pilus assembly protein [Chloroflexota bacterium]
MLRKLFLRLRRNEKGQDMVEFALVAPILLLLVMGIIDFGRVFNAYLVTTHGAREGARYAAVGYSDGEIVNRVLDTTGNLTIQVGVSGSRVQGQPMIVTVSTNVDLLTGIIANMFLQNPVPLSSMAEMRYEGPKI